MSKMEYELDARAIELKRKRQKAIRRQERRHQKKKKRMKGLDKYVIFCFVRSEEHTSELQSPY